ncbi:MAG TPA: ATP-binding protein [Vicinamibacterales bacterium]|nr:ATP-binding protein [Vicinamibacterales bacterium]
MNQNPSGVREEVARLRQEAATLREEAVRAREEAAQVRATLEQLMSQMREVNERLVVATVHAQTMAEDAERANSLKDEFLATVSHELRTPLNAILGWTRILAAMELPQERATHGIATVERNALALTHIIDDLLDVSRTIAGAFQLEAQPIDLIAVVEAALEVVRPAAEARNVHLAFSPPSLSYGMVRGDAGRLEQVVWNLLANAVKFTPPGGRVNVSVEPASDCVQIKIVDTGQGISPEFLPHVFERFRQADGTTTRRHSGLGLGLAIVRQLVALHGGTVQAESAGEGLGATFTVRLPVAADETRAGRAVSAGDRAVASAAAPVPGSPLLDKLHILVVDDNADGRTLTSLMLTEAGATVKAVETVREALHVIAMERPDALVSDIGLADEDGYALIRRIRQAEADVESALPALALTGYTRAEDRARTLAAGFQAYLAKPVDAARLTAAIAAITDPLRDRR